MGPSTGADLFEPVMPTQTTDLGVGVEAIDSLPADACNVNQFRMVEDVPASSKEAFRHVVATVLQWREDAKTQVQVDRALKWWLLIWDLMLRETHRGGRKGSSQLAARFEAFRTGDCRQLVVWHAADSLAVLNRQKPPSAQTSEAKTMTKVLCLVSEGELSKVTGLMLSHGLADLTDPHCQAQVAAKHPDNPKLVQRSLADFGEAGSEPIDAPSLRD